MPASHQTIVILPQVNQIIAKGLEAYFMELDGQGALASAFFSGQHDGFTPPVHRRRRMERQKPLGKHDLDDEKVNQGDCPAGLSRVIVKGKYVSPAALASWVQARHSFGGR